MKIGVISDAHLFHKNAITPEMYQKIITKDMDDCDCIVDCGDLTDKSSLTARQMDDLSKIFMGMTKPMYFVAGNHDSLDNTTVASILRLNRQAFIITTPSILNDMLFIPYMDSKKEIMGFLKRMYDHPNRNQILLGFGHLNITSHPYAMFSGKDKSQTEKLNQYCKYLFNGHIHEIEHFNNLFGEIINTGACSSLTFGDKHIPNYRILEVKDDMSELISSELQYIEKSIVHMVLSADTKAKVANIDGWMDETMNATRELGLDVRFRIDLPNNPESLEYRKAIKDSYEGKQRVKSITFSYVSDKEATAKAKEEKQQEKISKVPLAQQLITQFETTCKMSLMTEIKEELTES